jgi:hypothetical protein
MPREKIKLEDFFPHDSPYNNRIVFRVQMVWEPWRIRLANMLMGLGFVEFEINGYGHTVARQTTRSNDIDLVISYIPETGSLVLSDPDTGDVIVTSELGDEAIESGNRNTILARVAVLAMKIGKEH